MEDTSNSLQYSEIVRLTGRSGNMQGIISENNQLTLQGVVRLDQGKGSQIMSFLDSTLGAKNYTFIPSTSGDGINMGDDYIIPLKKSAQIVPLAIIIMIANDLTTSKGDLFKVKNILTELQFPESLIDPFINQAEKAEDFGELRLEIIINNKERKI